MEILPSFLEKNPYRFRRNIQKLLTKPFKTDSKEKGRHASPTKVPKKR